MQRHHLFSTAISLIGLVIISYTSALFGIYVRELPNGALRLEVHPPLWSFIVIFIFLFFVILTIIRNTLEINNASLGTPRPESQLVVYAGQKLKVLGSHEFPPHPRVPANKHKFATIFLFEESNEATKKLPGPAIFYCFTSVLFEKGENIKIGYEPEFKMLGYYDDRCLRQKVEI